MAERSIRDFQASFDVAPVADAWAAGNSFALTTVEGDGSRHYVRGSGLLTGQMMCVVRQSGSNVRVEAYIHARLLARISGLFLIPENMSIEPGGFMGALPRKICREAVDKLLAQLGQAPITAGDSAAAPATFAGATPRGGPHGGAVHAGAGATPIYEATAVRPFGIFALAIVEAVNAVVCLTVVPTFWSSFNWRASDDQMEWAALDLLMVFGYLALVGGSIAVAWRLWHMRRDAWLAAIEVGAGVIAITVISGVLWGFELLGFVGIALHAGIIAYLNTAQVRALFARGPLTAAAS